MSDRQFPDKLHPLPTQITGAGVTHEVMAAFRVPFREGEIPNQAVLIGWDRDRPENHAFVVWDAAVRSGTWTPYSGFWDASWPEAAEEFARRVTSRA